jgi:hypothetical protein
MKTANEYSRDALFCAVNYRDAIDRKDYKRAGLWYHAARGYIERARRMLSVRIMREVA